MTNIDDWPLWKRASLFNILTMLGIAIGFASAQVSLSPHLWVPITVFTAAFANLMFLVVRPRILAAKRTGAAPISAWDGLHKIIIERPLVFLVVVLQLIGTSRSLTTAVTFFQAAYSQYVRSLPNASTLFPRMIAMSLVMTGVAAFWLLGAIGLWWGRTWAWWVTIALNGLSAGTCLILQLLIRTKYLLDIAATIAVIILLLPAVRMQYVKSLKTA